MLKSIFRTFLKGGGADGKKCVDKHKGISAVRSYEEAEQFNSFGGVLKENYIDISFDDPKMSERFLALCVAKGWKCIAIKNTSTGHIHSFWKDTKKKVKKFNADIPLACGYVADIHGGETYIPLRVLGEDRFPPVYSLVEGEECMEIPDELLPVNTKIKLWGLKNGEGRNDSLFRYILVLQTQLKMTENQIKELYRSVINPYVFSEPLPEEELETILRSENFSQNIKPAFYKDNQFLFNTFARYFMQQHRAVFLNEQIHIYLNGVYVSDRRLIESAMIQILPTLRSHQRKEVYQYLELIADPVTDDDARYIAFKNGIYDRDNKQLLPFSPEYVVTNQIPWNYNPNAYHSLTDETLNNWACNDTTIRALLEECIGYCFYRKSILRAAFMLLGDKANGKSTFLTLLINLLGNENISALDVKELGDRFSTCRMYGKLANIGDDISDEFIQGSQISIFKKIITGNRIKAEQKGIPTFEFNPYCTLLFSANEIPKMKDKTGAVRDRLVIIPFQGSFRPYLPDGSNNPDYKPNLLAELTVDDSMEYLIQLGLNGLERILRNNGFTQSSKVEKELNEYDLENNPVLGFIAEQKELGLDIAGYPTSDIYARFAVYCTENNIPPMSKTSFIKDINRLLNLESITARININGQSKVVKAFRSKT